MSSTSWCFLIVVKMIKPIILGLAWLDKWEPHHMVGGLFQKTEVSTWARTNGTGSCGRSRGGGTMGTTGRHCRRGFPNIYRDLADVFSEDKCEVLPLHHSTDCTIYTGLNCQKPVYIQ